VRVAYDASGEVAVRETPETVTFPAKIVDFGGRGGLRWSVERRYSTQVGSVPFIEAAEARTFAGAAEPFSFAALHGPEGALERRRLDAGGRVVRQWVDSPADGRQDDAFFTRRDAFGREVARVRDRDGDGVPERVERWVRSPGVEVYYDSLRADALPSRAITRRFDGAGRLLAVEDDWPLDGLPETVTTYTYDAAGRPVTMASNGRIVQRWTYAADGGVVVTALASRTTTDALGRPVRYEVPERSQFDLDSIRWLPSYEWQYDADGLPVAEIGPVLGTTRLSDATTHDYTCWACDTEACRLAE
jgi:YD repeat-containing protein